MSIQETKDDILIRLRSDGDDERQHVREARCELGGLLDEAANMIEALREDAARYKKGYEAAMKIIKPQFPEKFADQYFVCGEMGAKDKNNLPDRLMVCPAYGVSWSQIYKRTDETNGQ
jgi:hypothetical protein